MDLKPKLVAARQLIKAFTYSELEKMDLKPKLFIANQNGLQWD